MTTKTKQDRLLTLLKREWVGPLDALERCGILSLAQRVSNWRAAGIPITDRWQTSPSGSRYKQYKVARG
jgi:hypothetical protein